MLQSDEEILVTVLGSAFLMIMLTVIVVIAIVKYKNRARIHLQEVSSLKSQYEQEILKAQLEMQEQTFLSISQEIHDNIGQILSLIRLNISTIKIENKEISVEKINSSKDLLDKAIEDLRAMSKKLNTRYLNEQSLPDLIDFQLVFLQKTGLYRTNLEVQGEYVKIDPEKKLILFRIIQEAFNNIIKHAEAKCISVKLMYTSSHLNLTIKDDGRGFNTDEISTKGLGTQNMTDRARLVGARFSIDNTIEAGTTINLTLAIDS